MSSNDTCIKFLHEWFSEIGIDWDTNKNCVQCLRHIINFLFQAFLFAKLKEILKAVIDVMIEVTDGDINDVILESFARVLFKSNAQLEASQATLQAKIRKCKHNWWGNIAFIEDFGGIEILLILQKFYKLVVWVRNFFLHLNLWDEVISFCLSIDNLTYWFF